MANKLRFPIRYKILGALSAVVIAAIGLYLFLASKVFYDDKTLLIYEVNQTNVRTLTADLESNLKRTLDKLHLIATLIASSGTSPVWLSEDDENLVTLSVYKTTGQSAVDSTPLVSKQWLKYLSAFGKDSDYLQQIRKQTPVPFDRVLAEGLWVRAAHLAPVAGAQESDESPPLMTVATAVEIEGRGKLVLVADVRADQIEDSFAQSGLAETYATDSDGAALLHSNRKLVGTDLRSDPLLTKAMSSKVRSQVLQFDDAGAKYLGAFYQAGVAKIAVASRVKLGEAYAAARILMQKSVLYAGIVITAAFLIVLFLSHSLTEPIRKLVDATRKIADGDFSTDVTVDTRDELSVLANSFNIMTGNLKSSRAQIEEYNRELEQKVADRTAKLEAQNIAIRETQEALVRTTRLASVGEIAGRAAHEVLNPLTSMMARLEKIQTQGLAADSSDMKVLAGIVEGWSQEFSKGGMAALMKSLAVKSSVYEGKTLLEEDLANLEQLAKGLDHRRSDRDNDVKFLLRESGRISKIVNGMRQLTRVSGNRKAVDIHQTLSEAGNTMRDLLNRHKIAFDSQFKAETPVVVSDHDELLQVFCNIIRNSAQALEEGVTNALVPGDGRKIWITTDTIPAGNDTPQRVAIRIGDNGPGIPNDKFETVFEPTYTTKSVSEGTGLGLAIARRFIRASEGEIIVETSEPGVATVFLITLPIQQQV